MRITMGIEENNENWEKLTYSEKNHQLFLRQKALLALFLEKRAISRQQYENRKLRFREEKNRMRF